MRGDWQIDDVDRHPTQGLYRRDGRVYFQARPEDFKPLQAIFDDGTASRLSQAGWLPGMNICEDTGDAIVVELHDVVPPLRAHEAIPSFRRDAGLAFLSLYEDLARHGLTIFDCNLDSFLPDRFGRPRFFDLARIVPEGARKFPYRSFCSQILAPLQLFERRPDLAELLCRPPLRLSPEQYMEIVAPRRAEGHAIAVVEHRPAAADRLTDDIVAQCELYATRPHAGIPRGDLGEGFRVLVRRPYLVVYRPIDDGIEVLRILDGRRDYRSLFS